MSWLYGLTPWQQTILATCFTWGCTAGGALLVFFIKEVKGRFLALILSTAGGIMLSSTFFSLLLPAREYVIDQGWWILSVALFMGVVLIELTNIIVQKIRERTQNKNYNSNLIMCLAVTIHNIPEGLAVGIAFGAVGDGRVTLMGAIILALGIGVQNFPEGACVSLPMHLNGVSKGKSFFVGQLSGFVEVIGGCLGVFMVNCIRSIMPWALSFSAGAMLNVVCVDLIPQSVQIEKNYALWGLICGFCLMMALDLFFV